MSHCTCAQLLSTGMVCDWNTYGLLIRSIRPRVTSHLVWRHTRDASLETASVVFARNRNVVHGLFLWLHSRAPIEMLAIRSRNQTSFTSFRPFGQLTAASRVSSARLRNIIIRGICATSRLFGLCRLWIVSAADSSAMWFVRWIIVVAADSIHRVYLRRNGYISADSVHAPNLSPGLNVSGMLNTFHAFDPSNPVKVVDDFGMSMHIIYMYIQVTRGVDPICPLTLRSAVAQR